MTSFADTRTHVRYGGRARACAAGELSDAAVAILASARGSYLESFARCEEALLHFGVTMEDGSPVFTRSDGAFVGDRSPA